MEQLSADRLRSLVNYDEITGVFTKRTLKSPKPFGMPLGCKNGVGYLVLRIGKVNYSMHRLAWLYVHGEFPSGVIDHINMNRTDNRIDNLRDVPRRVNQENRKQATKKNSTKMLGVCFVRERGHYIAQIQVKGKNKYLGSFDTAESAHLAYIKEKRLLHEGCSI